MATQTLAIPITTSAVNRRHLQSTARPSHSTFTPLFSINYPENWFFIDIQKAFATFGVYGTVTLARKKNRLNLKFGFMRLDHECDVSTILNRLNQVRIGAYRIRAFLSKYPRPNQASNMQRHIPAHPKPLHPKHPPATFKESIRNNRSYSQVVSHKPLIFNTPSDEPKLFQNSLIVSVQHIDKLLHVHSFLKDIEIVYETISFLGGRFFSIGFHNEVCMNRFKLNFPSMAAFFDSCIPFDGHFALNERYVWITLIGVPLSAWNENFFMMVGNTLGQSTTIHPSTISREHLDCGSVLISTASHQIDCYINAVVNGKDFIIRIYESDIPINFSGELFGTQSASDSGTDSDSDSQAASKSDPDPKQVVSPSLSGSAKSINSAATSPTPDLSFITQRRKDIPVHNQTDRQNLLQAEETEAQKTWAIGLKLGLFSEEHEREIIELISQGINKDQPNHS